MKNIYKITTGFAYLVKDGVAHGKLCLRIGAEYHTEDVLVEVASQEELDAVSITPIPRTKDEILREKKYAVSALEIKNLRKLYDGEDMTDINAERLRLRNEIKKLEGR